jgi:hypothetical protein
MRAGTRRSLSPHTSSVGARTAGSVGRTSCAQTNLIPRAIPSGPVRSAPPTTIGRELRMSTSSCSNGNARPTNPRPHEIPAGATSTSRRTRSGEVVASCVATMPPSEWPTTSTRSKPIESSQRESHALRSPASSLRGKAGRSTAYTWRCADSGSITDDHQRDEPASPCTSTSGFPVPASTERRLTIRPLGTRRRWKSRCNSSARVAARWSVPILLADLELMRSSAITLIDRESLGKTRELCERLYPELLSA